MVLVFFNLSLNKLKNNSMYQIIKKQEGRINKKKMKILVYCLIKKKYTIISRTEIRKYKCRLQI